MTVPPLAGVRVLNLGGLGPVPFATMMLSDLGADTVRIDRVGTATSAQAQHAARFKVLNRGTRSVALDLSHPDGAAVARDLAAASDVVLEGFRPGTVERLGIGPAEVHGLNPTVVYARVSGWGRQGPLATAPGHDINYLARNGVLGLLGRAGEPPAIPLNIVADLAGGGVLAVCGVLSALLARERTGQGDTVDLAMVEGAGLMVAMIHGMAAAGEWRAEPGTNLLDSGAPFYDVYRTADGRWLSIGALEPQFFDELLSALGLEWTGDRDDVAQWPELRHLISERVATRSLAEWTELLDGRDTCAAPVLSLPEWSADPQSLALNSFVEIDGVRQPRPPLRFERAGRVPDRPSGRPGAATLEVLTEWLALDGTDLLARGVAADAVGAK